MESLLEDPQIVQTGVFQQHEHPTEGPLRFMRHPIAFEAERQPEQPAPGLGEHTSEVLAEAGLSDAEIRALVTKGAALQG
jgi:crotonobetainyl-CoA:carnitine CoA-transferase CaiB-like acyl-CoA transferase